MENLTYEHLTPLLILIASFITYKAWPRNNNPGFAPFLVPLIVFLSIAWGYRFFILKDISYDQFFQKTKSELNTKDFKNE